MSPLTAGTMLRRLCLLKSDVDAYVTPLSWYAGIPLLIIAPVLFFMLSANEAENSHWLPLVALIKALGIPAFAVFIAEALQTMFRFGAGDDGLLIKTIISAVFFILGDAIIGVYCFGRNRILCK